MTDLHQARPGLAALETPTGTGDGAAKATRRERMNYLTCITQDTVTLAEIQPPKAGPGEIVVRLAMCGICGTDTAKVFGAYPKPQKLGHEVVGTVHELGQGVSKFAQGQRVALAHHVPDYATHYARRGSETMDALFKRSNIDPGGFAELIRIPVLHVNNTVFAIPDHMPMDRAVFMEPMACCLRALDRVSLIEGDSCLVVGAGAVGMLFVPLLRDRAVTTVIADMRAERIELAQAWGAAAGGVPGTDDVAAICKGASAGRGVDCVVLTVVTAATVQLAMDAVRDGGTIVIFGGKPGTELTMPMWDIWVREINLVSSYSATPDGLRRAMAILSGRTYEGLERLISHRMPLAEAQAAFEVVQKGAASKVVIVPGN
ncbi:MAG: alcohol dehydrogenase catalytic domain-containing protein [Alphaproteobacteria bacterium]|nr:alcohol dehydrogenase catalytic domain-containing protein [Alphaproteobacteria bacterium]